MSPTNDFKLPPDLELDRIITLQEAEKISSLSVNSGSGTTRTRSSSSARAVLACGCATR